jgi:hypothetical protein
LSRKVRDCRLVFRFPTASLRHVAVSGEISPHAGSGFGSAS